MTHILIIGGSDAGVSAGLRARHVDPSVGTTVVAADAFPNYSICGIPYHISGDVPDWRNLAHRTRDDLEHAGLRLLLDTRARHIDPTSRTVTVSGPGGRDEELRYDRLIIGTGAVPVRPPIAGLHELTPADGVHLLHTMDDTLSLAETLQRGPESALIVGAGYIGLEMAEALHARGLQVTVVEQIPQVLGTVDPQLATLVADELTRHGVRVVTDTTVTEVAREGGRLKVTGHSTNQLGDSGSFSQITDVVLVVVGVRPDTALAQTAGVRLRVRGAIAVDRHMRTGVPDVYAAGDCVHTYHRLLDTNTYLPLGSTSHKQGRVAGENATGGDRQFAGSLGTQAVKVFDLVAARTGLRDADAREHGFDPATHVARVDDHKAYYPRAKPVTIAITGDQRSGQLLGAQLVGHRDTAVATRVDIYAGALHHRMTVDALTDLDLSYTPPLGSPWDAVQTAAQRWVSARTADLP
ncbi:FAD-dependent oxidoreductase [Micromonospora aurantiaca (nom. illeg.)]|uniref:FAD-dependent oxidoreductase n=1 Tax=Micromonospora aurantiaca (nom. illeg.) TaxID=47850 RepID=UPI003437EDD4